MNNLAYFVFCCGGLLMYIGLFCGLIFLVKNIIQLIFFGKKRGNEDEKVYKKPI